MKDSNTLVKYIIAKEIVVGYSLFLKLLCCADNTRDKRKEKGQWRSTGQWIEKRDFEKNKSSVW